jgi:signal recognition particle receptor subunit beta
MWRLTHFHRARIIIPQKPFTKGGSRNSHSRDCGVLKILLILLSVDKTKNAKNTETFPQKWHLCYNLVVAFFNYVTKEITLKVVYYGPGLSGKTTNLQHLYSILDPASRGKFISLATEADRTLFFDFLPVHLGRIKEFTLRFQLYTVPGQIRYNATRKLVLKGADAIVFVADSQREMREQNIESFDNMKENLLSNNIDPDTIPLIYQYNKRDLPSVLSLEELNRDLNKKSSHFLEAEAVNGKGVEETFRFITKTLLKDIAHKHKVDIVPPKDEGISIKIHEKNEFEMETTVPLEEPEEIVDAVASGSQTRAPEAPMLPDERWNTIEESLSGITLSLSQIRDSRVSAQAADTITTNTEELSKSLSKINDTLSFLSSEVNETKRQQSDMLKVLREMELLLVQIRKKRKRSWFRF